MEYRSRRRKRMTIGEKLGAVGAVIGALVIIICMVLYIPFIKVDGEQISLMQMFKDSKPLESMEGELSSKTSSYEVRSEVDSTLDDGLDLDQLVEGQFTILFCGFDEGRSNTDVNMLAVCDIAANTINILQIPRDSYVPDYTSFKAGKFNSVYSMGGRLQVQDPADSGLRGGNLRNPGGSLCDHRLLGYCRHCGSDGGRGSGYALYHTV